MSEEGQHNSNMTKPCSELPSMKAEKILRACRHRFEDCSSEGRLLPRGISVFRGSQRIKEKHQGINGAISLQKTYVNETKILQHLD